MKTLLIAAVLFVALGIYVQVQSPRPDQIATFDYCYKSAPDSVNDAGQNQENCSFHIHFDYPKHFVQNTLAFCSNVFHDALQQNKAAATTSH